MTIKSSKYCINSNNSTIGCVVPGGLHNRWRGTSCAWSEGWSRRHSGFVKSQQTSGGPGLCSNQVRSISRLKRRISTVVLVWTKCQINAIKCRLELPHICAIVTFHHLQISHLLFLLVRKPLLLPVHVTPFRVCFQWPTHLPLPPLPPLHLLCPFPEDLQRVWVRSRKKVAGQCGSPATLKRQDMRRRNQSLSGLENVQSNGQHATSAMMKVQMSKKLWERVLKIQTMVSNDINWWC